MERKIMLVEAIQIILDSKIRIDKKEQLINFIDKIDYVSEEEIIEMTQYLEELNNVMEAAISLIDLSNVNASEAIDKLNEQEEMVVETLASLKHERSPSEDILFETRKKSKYFE